MSILVRQLSRHDNIGMAGMTDFGLLLKNRREALGLRQEDVASRIGRPNSFYARIEGGKNANPPSPDEFRELAGVLGLSQTEMVAAIGYIDPDTTGDDPIPATILRELRSINWSSSWKTEYMLDAIRGLRRMEEQIGRIIAEEGGGYE